MYIYENAPAGQAPGPCWLNLRIAFSPRVTPDFNFPRGCGKYAHHPIVTNYLPKCAQWHRNCLLTSEPPPLNTTEDQQGDMILEDSSQLGDEPYLDMTSRKKPISSLKTIFFPGIFFIQKATPAHRSLLIIIIGT